MRVYFVRHGQTDWNKELKYQGHSDIPLNEIGIKEAEYAAKYLENEKLDAIFSSDLKRAFKTGEIIGAKHSLTPIKDARLREINFGAWEGLDFNKVYEKYKLEFDSWFKDPINYFIPEGGNIGEVADNLISFFKEIANHKFNTIAVATHGGVIKALLWLVKKELDVLWEQKISPGSITIAKYDSLKELFLLEKVNIIP